MTRHSLEDHHSLRRPFPVRFFVPYDFLSWCSILITTYTSTSNQNLAIDVFVPSQMILVFIASQVCHIQCIWLICIRILFESGSTIDQVKDAVFLLARRYYSVVKLIAMFSF